jgi:alanine-glyoxylate transaminase / serine-glyoxylate transaminase / serine-pyruvate transaminase
VAIYIGNGHAGWEAANCNVFSRGDRALVLATGRFGIGWASQPARAWAWRWTRSTSASRRRSIRRGWPRRLAADRGHAIRAVLVTHVDTATSVRNDIAALRAALDAAGHPGAADGGLHRLAGCDEFRMDDWGVDVMVAASQKGLMVPPGLAFVWFSDQGARGGRRADLRTPYWDWEPRIAGEHYYQCSAAPRRRITSTACARRWT